MIRSLALLCVALICPLAEAQSVDGQPRRWRFVGTWRTARDGEGGSRSVVRMRHAALPSSFVVEHVNDHRWRLPPSWLLERTDFGALEAVPSGPRRGVEPVLDEMPGHRIAQVFFEDTKWGALFPMPLAGASRGSVSVALCERFELRFDGLDSAGAPVAVLQAPDGIVRLPLTNRTASLSARR